MWCQVRVPNVHNKHEPHRVPIMPDFMVKGVVKDYELALNPLPSLVGHSHPWPERDHEAEVRTDSAISWTGVGPDVSNWMHYRELYLQTTDSHTKNNCHSYKATKLHELYMVGSHDARR